MSQLSRFAQAISLLMGGKVASLSTIMRSCDIAERTAYRYLSVMRDAKLPVYYDANMRGYRFYRLDSKADIGFELNSCAYIVFALSTLKRNISLPLQAEVDRIVEQVVSRASDKVILSVESEGAEADASSSLISTLLQTGVVSRRTMTLNVKAQDDSVFEYKAVRGRLEYDTDWLLVSSEGEPTKVSDIVSVRIDEKTSNSEPL